MKKRNQNKLTYDVECKCKSSEMLKTPNHSIMMLN